LNFLQIITRSDSAGGVIYSGKAIKFPLFQYHCVSTYSYKINNLTQQIKTSVSMLATIKINGFSSASK